MPFNVGPFELIVILLIVIAVFGAGRIAGIGRALGTSVREFREEARNEDEEEGEEGEEGEQDGEDEVTSAADAAKASADDAETPPAKKKEDTTT